MSQAAFSLLTAGIKFKGLKESEKHLFKKGSMRCVDSAWLLESGNAKATTVKSESDAISSIDFFNYSSIG